MGHPGKGEGATAGSRLPVRRSEGQEATPAPQPHPPPPPGPGGACGRRVLLGRSLVDTQQTLAALTSDSEPAPITPWVSFKGRFYF